MRKIERLLVSATHHLGLGMRPPARLKRFAAPALVVLCALALAGLFAPWGAEEKTLTATQSWGNVDARHASLAFEGSGRIESLLVREGDRVAAGDELGRLDTTALGIEKTRADALYRALKAQADMAQSGYRAEDVRAAQKNAEAAASQLAQAERTYARQAELFKSSATSRQNLDDARYAVGTLKSQLAAAQAAADAYAAGPRPEEVAAAIAQAEAAKAQADRIDYEMREAAVLKAPFAGVVRARLAEPGDMASPAKTIFEVSIVSPKRIRTYLTERQLGLVREGADAMIRTDTTPPVPAKVSFIADTAEFTPKTVQTEALRSALVYEVQLEAQDPDNRLRLGQPVTVEFAPDP